MSFGESMFMIEESFAVLTIECTISWNLHYGFFCSSNDPGHCFLTTYAPWVVYFSIKMKVLEYQFGRDDGSRSSFW
ncbi:hypothetical protein EUGRSUZ_C03102 [Eucalyptus grandis]|uniref:Uncharacterized protein n=2 Tax=Eucalyptus grandis TaxID=71139 RepID=A0ACC3LHH0_EUCGR|nr:hypothetical protein EUGRSUZ_C03102 [Eucalyptus grandis]